MSEISGYICSVGTNPRLYVKTWSQRLLSQGWEWTDSPEGAALLSREQARQFVIDHNVFPYKYIQAEIEDVNRGIYWENCDLKTLKTQSELDVEDDGAL